MPLNWEEETAVSEKIFQGKVIAVNNNRFDIEVLEIWKGEFVSNVFQLMQGATSCTSRTFEMGEEYLFYTQGNEVSNCSRTVEYYLTIDAELLNAKFKGVGNLTVIEADELTEFQRSVLKNLFKRSGSAWPADFDRINPRFAVEFEYVTKRVFFEVIRTQSYSLQLKKINNRQADIYILWLGRDWKKAESKLKMKV
ncbi:MAG: hypothetical protein HOP30_15365 [Cyclobacteriaceae bacterium]|nr:hypothetical protein [Cyclobacteriaceae bacterium]